MSRKYKFHSKDGVYFVSFTTVQWVDIFTRNIYRDIIVDSLNYCIENKGLVIYAWVIMTNHVHLIIRSESLPLQEIMRDLKRHTSKNIIHILKSNPRESRKSWLMKNFVTAGNKNSNNKGCQFWQQHNHPLEINSKTSGIERYINYIHQNPVKAGFVSSPEHYLYSSALDYSGCTGLVNVEIA